MTFTFTHNDSNPTAKLADVELHFTDGPLAGLKLIGFSVWEYQAAGARYVTFPARVVRPISGATDDTGGLREAILDAYQAELNDQSTDAASAANIIRDAQEGRLR